MKDIIDKDLTTNYDLYELCNELKIPLTAICMKDELKTMPANMNTNQCYIINMQSSVDGVGTHWVGLFLPKSSDQAIYFDSFGIDPPIAVILFCSRSKRRKIITSQKQIQDPMRGGCGQYVVLFLKYITGSPRATRDLKSIYRSFLNSFSTYS